MPDGQPLTKGSSILYILVCYLPINLANAGSDDIDNVDKLTYFIS